MSSSLAVLRLAAWPAHSGSSRFTEMGSGHRLSLSVQYASKAKQVPTRAQFRRWVGVAQEQDIQLTLRLVDEAEGRELNRDFREKDYATNVLTFVYDEDTQPRHGGVAPSGAGGAAQRLLPQSAGSASNVSQPLLAGDVVICAPVVEREAREQGKDLLAHYAHLTIHAVLHMQGYEHDENRDAQKMEKRETALMAKLRYADPYRE
jgi:probable rRNA maturation factor